MIGIGFYCLFVESFPLTRVELYSSFSRRDGRGTAFISAILLLFFCPALAKEGDSNRGSGIEWFTRFGNGGFRLLTGGFVKPKMDDKSEKSGMTDIGEEDSVYAINDDDRRFLRPLDAFHRKIEPFFPLTTKEASSTTETPDYASRKIIERSLVNIPLMSVPSAEGKQANEVESSDEFLKLVRSCLIAPLSELGIVGDSKVGSWMKQLRRVKGSSEDVREADKITSGRINGALLGSSSDFAEKYAKLMALVLLAFLQLRSSADVFLASMIRCILRGRDRDALRRKKDSNIVEVEVMGKSSVRDGLGGVTELREKYSVDPNSSYFSLIDVLMNFEKSEDPRASKKSVNGDYGKFSINQAKESIKGFGKSEELISGVTRLPEDSRINRRGLMDADLIHEALNSYVDMRGGSTSNFVSSGKDGNISGVGIDMLDKIDDIPLRSFKGEFNVGGWKSVMA